MNDEEPQQQMLDWLGLRHAPNWLVARTLGKALTVFIALLIAGAYLSAFAIVYNVLFGGSVANLGTGALIAALLGAPFVIWGTALKHQTLRYQKEGHITDRITSAVEQLGSQKTVNRIGRPVTIWTGKPKKVSCRKERVDKYLAEPRSKLTGKELTQEWDHEAEEHWEGYFYSIAIWPNEKTVIQWQGQEVSPLDSEEIGHVGVWQVFTETEPNIEVRIGAILSLERIAQDSTLYDKGRDHVRVMETLCAYVRENSPANEAPNLAFPQGCDQDSFDEKLKAHVSWIYDRITPQADIQLALSVIGRRTKQQVKIERDHFTQEGKGYRIDLSGTNLRYSDLQFLNFENANFFRSQVQAAYCMGANFEGANFTYCELTGISAANANFRNAKLEIADLSHATLTGANLYDCKITHTHFVRANLQGAEFRFLKNKESREVNRAFFIHSNLKGASIEGDLFGVIFRFRILRDETIPRDIYGVKLRQCRIAGTREIFEHSHTESAFPAVWLDATFGDASVMLSEDMERPDHWPTWKLPADGNNSFETEWRKWQASPPSYLPPSPPGD